jgi:HSP20 family protein
MNLQQFNPWNWFKHEEAQPQSTIPVKRSDKPADKNLPSTGASVMQLHREIDRLFDDAFRGFPTLGSRWFDQGVFSPAVFEARLNVASDDKNYHVSLEVPGMTEKDISLELTNNILTIRGEKKEENETKDKHYYRVERSYGSFQRVLNLPEDCDQASIAASIKNGVLDIQMPRKSLPASERKQIPIKTS